MTKLEIKLWELALEPVKAELKTLRKDNKELKEHNKKLLDKILNKI